MDFRKVQLTVAPTGTHSNITFDGQGINARRFTLDCDYQGVSRLTVECHTYPDPEPTILDGYFIGTDELSEAAIDGMARLLRQRLTRP